MWANKSAAQAHGILVKPDVKVTNQSDKDQQLPKLLKLNEFAIKVIAEQSSDTGMSMVQELE